MSIKRNASPKNFPGISVFTDLDEMIETGGFDGIIAVTPTAITAQIAIKIMEAGIPLSMEKPLGMNMAEADAVLACQQRTKCQGGGRYESPF